MHHLRFSFAGVRVAGCLGVTLADGTCISADGKIVWAERAGATLWEYADPALTSLSVATERRRIVVADGVGGVYTSTAEGFDPITLTRVPTRFLAIDALRRTLR